MEAARVEILQAVEARDASAARAEAAEGKAAEGVAALNETERRLALTQADAARARAERIEKAAAARSAEVEAIETEVLRKLPLVLGRLLAVYELGLGQLS